MPAALPPASTTRRGINPSTFMGASFAAGSGLEERVSLNERNITNLKNVIDLRKINTGKFLKPEDEENLEERLVNIADSLNILSRALNKGLILDKKVAAVDAKNLKEKDKTDAERKLEKKKDKSPGGFKKITAPVKGLFDNILRFLKNILIGSVLVKIFDWFNDEENENKIDEFAENLREKTKWIVAGLAGLLALNFAGPIMTMVRALRGLATLAGGIAGWTIRQLAKPFRKPKPPQGSPKGSPKGRAGGTGSGKGRLRIGGGSKISRNRLIPPNTRQLPGVKPGQVGGSTPGRAPSIPTRPPSNIGMMGRVGKHVPNWVKNIVKNIARPFMGRRIPLGALGKIFRILSLMDLYNRLLPYWQRDDYRSMAVILAAYGLGWLVTTLGWSASVAAGTAIAGGTMGFGTPGALLVAAGGITASTVAGAKTEEAILNRFLPQAQLSSAKVKTPSITSPSGTGDTQLLAFMSGRAQGLGGDQSAAPSGDGSSSSSGSGSQVPYFSSVDPNNLNQFVNAGIYDLVEGVA